MAQFTKKVFYATRTSALARSHDLVVVGHVVANRHRSLKLLKNVLGSFGKGVGLVFGKVKAPAEGSEENVDQDCNGKHYN